MGHTQSTTEARIMPSVTYEAWNQIDRLSRLQMSYDQAMTSHQRFIERSLLVYGENGAFN